MSQQEILYETKQYFTYKGKRLHIRFIDEYFDIVPRPLDEEKKFLKIKREGTMKKSLLTILFVFHSTRLFLLLLIKQLEVIRLVYQRSGWMI